MKIQTNTGETIELTKVIVDCPPCTINRIVSFMDDTYVFLQEDSNTLVDIKVNRSTGKVYQWLYGGWETSDYSILPSDTFYGD